MEQQTPPAVAALANLSHDLRTPLHCIMGFTNLLIDGKAGPLNDLQREYLGNVLSSGEELLLLITQVLDSSKLDAGSLARALKPSAAPTESR